jgi:hypothetical protein
MKNIAMTAVVCGMVAVSASVPGAQERHRPEPRHFAGLLNDHTPSAAVVAKGPYEMRGKWSLDVDEARGTATFTAAMDMQTSDYGIIQGTVNKDDPSTRGAHTHHITLADGVVSDDWALRCPAFSPAATSGFVVTGNAVVTGNGSGAPFGNPSPATVCVLGGALVPASNLTLTLGKPAANHFGTQAIHGVVTNCSRGRGKQSNDCRVE